MNARSVSSVLISLGDIAVGGVSTKVCSSGSQTSGGLTISGTTFTTGVAVCIEGLGVVTSLSGTTVNDGGKPHGVGTRDGEGAVVAKLHDTGDSDRLLPIGGLPRSCGGRPHTILSSILHGVTVRHGGR